MVKSELFLLLPVYEEVKGQPDYILRIGILPDAKLKEYIEKINDVVNFF